jgi:hypothetical protein
LQKRRKNESYSLINEDDAGSSSEEEDLNP